MLRLYFPESYRQMDFVGYNHAVSLLHKALHDRIVDKIQPETARFACNLPWHHNPKELKQGMPLIYYTMFESTRLPAAWVKFLNKHVDVALVPTRWNQNIFRQSGVKIPIFIVSLGYDNGKIKLTPKIEKMNEYVFCWVGVSADAKGRKGFDIILDAFKELKQSGQLGNDAKLIIKTKLFGEDNIKMNAWTEDGLLFLQEILSSEKMEEMYRQVDCCINTTRGEGFGLIPLEQMAMGKPIITAAWNIPYLKEGKFIPIDYNVIKSFTSWTHKHIAFSKNGLSINFGGLAHTLRFVPYRLISKRTERKEPIQIAGIKCVVSQSPTTFQILKNKFVNMLLTLQQKVGFIYDKRRVMTKILFENQGDMAEPSKEDLKKKMLWCYNNRKEANEIGKQAADYVSGEWTMNRIRDEYLIIEPELELIIKRRSHGLRK